MLILGMVKYQTLETINEKILADNKALKAFRSKK